MASNASGQVIWQEDFSGFADGTQQAPDGSWTTSFNDCDDTGPYTIVGAYWGVFNEQFRVNDIEGFSCDGNRGNNGSTFLTEVIDITGVGCANLSVTITNNGGLECDYPAGPNFSTSGFFSGHDQAYVEYQLDGGTWIAFPGGYFCGNDNGTTTVDELTGNTVRIRIRVGTQANNEEYYLDDIRVTGSTTTYMVPDLGPYCSTDEAQNLPTTIDGITGSWSGPGVSINTFAPSAVGSGTYSLTFTPDDGTCAAAQSTDTEVLMAPSFLGVADQSVCSNYVLPAIQGANVPPDAAYFTAPNGAGTRYETGDSITLSQQLYIFGENAGCTDQETFQVSIISPPALDNPGLQEVCSSFTFPNISGASLNDPRYYTQPDGSGEVYETGDSYAITAATTFYIYDERGTCSDQVAFQVTIIPPPDIDPIPAQTVCNEVTLPPISGSDLWDPAYYSRPGGNGTRYEIGETVRPGSDFRRFYAYDGFDGCSDSETFDVTFNRLEAAIELFRPVTCFGASDGQLAVRITEGTGPFRYNWSSPDNPANNPLNGAGAGTYYLTINYARVCVYRDSIVVPQPNSLILVCDEARDLSAPLANDGRISGSFTGGTGPYWVYLTGPVIDSLTFPTADSFAFTGLPRGDYQVLVVDDRGCAVDCFSFIEGPDCNVFATPQIRLPTCSDSEDGRIGLLTSGGTAPYTYDWSENRFDGRSSAENLPNGTYSVQVTGARGCTFDTTVVLPVIDPLALSCSNRSDTAVWDIQGGRAPYTAILAGPEPDTIEIATAGSLELPALATGEYTLLLTDASGCQQDCAFFIPDPNCELTVTPLVVDESCTVAGDGRITLGIQDPAGIPVINWLDGATDSVRTGLFPGTYSYTVEDTLGCRQIATVRVGTQNIAPFFTLMENDQPICANGCDSVQVLGLGRPPFSFSLEVQATDTTLSYPFAVTDSLSTVSFCLPPLGLADSLVTYRVTKFRDSVCPAGLEESFDRTLVPLDTQRVEPIICPSDSVVLAGDVFDRDSPNGFILLPGQGAACDSILRVDVQFHVLDTGLVTNILCHKDTLLVGDQLFDNQRPDGLVRFPLADRRGCDSLVQVDLTFSLPATREVTDTLCPGDSLLVGNTWFTQANPAGTVSIPGSGAGECDSLLQVAVVFQDPIMVMVSDPEPVCAGESSTFTLTTNVPGVSLVWDRDWSGMGQSFLQSADTATYSFSGQSGDTIRLLEVSDPASGCRQNSSLNITPAISQPVVSLETDSTYNGRDISCFGASDGRLRTEVTGGVSPIQYQWMDGIADRAERSDLRAGTYRITITDAAGCTDSTEYTLQEPPPLSLMLDGTPPSCTGQTNGSITIASIAGGTPDYSYTLNGRTEVPQPLPAQISGLSAGSYSLTVFDVNGCELTRDIVIAEPPVQLVDLPGEIELNLGDSVLLDPVFSFNPTQIEWRSRPDLGIPPVAAPVVRPLQTTEVMLAASDSIGCSVTATVQLIVDRQLQVYAPTAFHPGQDGPNGQFRLFSGNQVERIIFLRIFDRWGQLLFETEDVAPNATEAGWDGRVNGQLMPTGVYVFVAQVELADGRVEPLSGDITLLR
jgi:gliding motility-associated-like protein